MNAGELREFLVGYPDDMPVILEKDAEGNGYSPLCAAAEKMYYPTSSWSGECHPTDEEVDEGRWYSEEDRAPEGSVRAIVLGPVN